jgi:hypothetical protein
MYLDADLTNIDMHTTAYPYMHITVHLSLETNVSSSASIPMSHYQKTTYPNHKTNLPALSFGGGFDK